MLFEICLTGLRFSNNNGEEALLLLSKNTKETHYDRLTDEFLIFLYFVEVILYES